MMRCPPKPPWVKPEIIRLKALIPQFGCRKIADVFNRRFAHTKDITVGKTFVSDILRQHYYDIQVLRKKIKHQKPRPVSHNLIWGMDLTYLTNAQGETWPLLGLIEHHSRRCLILKRLSNKTSITLLRCLLACIEHCGSPKILRTDNEACFTSRLFRFGLWLLGIRHQRIDPHCPWQNGRIERFFGTFKE